MRVYCSEERMFLSKEASQLFEGTREENSLIPHNHGRLDGRPHREMDFIFVVRHISITDFQHIQIVVLPGLILSANPRRLAENVHYAAAPAGRFATRILRAAGTGGDSMKLSCMSPEMRALLAMVDAHSLCEGAM